MRTARTAGLAVLLTLVPGACGSTTPSPLTSSATDGGTDPSASATTGLTSQLAAFEGRLRDATTREGLLVRTIAAASAGTRAEVRLAVAQMRRWVDGERAWLAAHPVEGCYESAGRKFAEALDSMSTSADWFGAIAEASAAPSDDVSLPSAGTEAGQSLQDAARALLDAAALAKVARTTCR